MQDLIILSKKQQCILAEVVSGLVVPLRKLDLPAESVNTITDNGLIVSIGLSKPMLRVVTLDNKRLCKQRVRGYNRLNVKGNTSLPWWIINFDIIHTNSEINGIYLNTEMLYYTLLDRIVEVVMENLGLWQGRSDYVVYSNFFEECVPFSIEPAIRNLHKIGETCFKIDIENSIKVPVNLIDNGEKWLNCNKPKLNRKP